jgi:hypothetical protein
MRPRIATFLLALPLLAQSDRENVGLPATSLIVERQPLPGSAHQNRALLLWMEHFEKHDESRRLKQDSDYTCPDMTTGSVYYSGPTRISLIDTSSNKVINTVKLLSPDGKDSFDVPFRIAKNIWGHSGHYEVPGPLVHGEGKPALLALKDYNGDGKALEAAFFVAEACMGLPTTLIGYSISQDRIIQYEVDSCALGEDGKTRAPAATWVDYLFAKAPLRPGYWKYTIDYRGRTDDGNGLERFEIRYDAKHERFKDFVGCGKP